MLDCGWLPESIWGCRGFSALPDVSMSKLARALKRPLPEDRRARSPGACAVSTVPNLHEPRGV
jgi:hypothetical protein